MGQRPKPRDGQPLLRLGRSQLNTAYLIATPYATVLTAPHKQGGNRNCPHRLHVYGGSTRTGVSLATMKDLSPKLDPLVGKEHKISSEENQNNLRSILKRMRLRKPRLNMSEEHNSTETARTTRRLQTTRTPEGGRASSSSQPTAKLTPLA